MVVMHPLVRKNLILPRIYEIIIGIFITIFGYFLYLYVYNIGYAVNLINIIPFVGVGLILLSIYRLFAVFSNPVYKSWKFYGDSVIDEINDQINKENEGSPKGSMNELIASNSWIIDKNNFIFAKPSDINYFYLHLWEGNFKVNFFKINIYTTFGVQFDVLISKPITAEDFELQQKEAITILEKIKKICPNAINEYNPVFNEMWKKSPQDFIKMVREIDQSHK